MNDDRARLEQLMRDRAAEVPHRQDAPPRMLGRARRRVARNVVASVVALGVVVAGASAGLGALRGPDNAGPATHPSTPPPSTPACIAADLRATARLDGAMGSVEGAIDVTNVSPTTCTLTGRPSISLVGASGDPLAPHVRGTVPQWWVDHKPRPDGWPVVTLRPGEVASIRVRWSNQCPQMQDAAQWTVDLGAGRGTLDVFGANTTSPPPCNGTAMPSTLDVGPFEPGTE